MDQWDKVIIVDGHHFLVNSTILATQSSFFEKLFSCGLRETKEINISLHLPQLTKRGFSDWLEEIEHPGSVVLRRENVPEILRVANFTQSHWVIDQCIDGIKTLIGPTNYFEEGKSFEIKVYSLAYLFDIKSLQSLTRRFVMANLAEALKVFEFQNAIGGRELIQILKAEELNVLNEENLFLGIMDWINSDLPARQQFTAGILQLVYLHCVPARILKENLYVEAFMKDATCRDLYIDALHCHAIKEVRETRTQRPRYQRCRTSNKVSVTFKARRSRCYEHEDNTWHVIPAMDGSLSEQKYCKIL
ncbi:kelch-like protein 17 [Antedon mediterranea]|uniref:kelch-like protein 17 n=1 Tax=Antedon mediterranea TaxID=105859 RepID=UPI003AF9285C